MKICYLADGESIHTKRWCTHFADLGHEIHLITFKEVNDLRKKRILLIDDEVGFSQILKFNLEDAGDYEVYVENFASQGLEAIRRVQPDLVLLDVVMPDVEGPDIMFQLRNDDAVKYTPVVFLTATVTKEEVDSQGGSICGHPFIAKPADMNELIDCIEKNITL